LKTELIINEPTPSLNKLRKMHHSDYQRLRDKYQYEARSQTHCQHPGPVKITLTRISVGVLDYDNLVGGAKPLIDALVNAGILPGDKPVHIPQRDYQQAKAISKNQQRTHILIEDI
jgi:hypothetical protein